MYTTSAKMLLMLLLLVPLALQAASDPELLQGQVTVIDGDTLELHGERIRLAGMDAPETQQVCQREGMSWRCGKDAAWHLDQLIAGRLVTCSGLERDRYGRFIGTCFAEPERLDLSRQMVRDGAALAYRQYSTAYVVEENAARSEQLGLWHPAVTFEAPWTWRQNKRR